VNFKKLRYDPETGEVTRVIGTRTSNGYLTFKVGRKRFSLHRVIWFMETGEWPEYIDHINGNGLDNRWDNLRSVNKSENSRNCKRSKANATGITGVYWNKVKGKWQARIRAFGRDINLYFGRDFFEACCQRKSAEVKYGYHENHGR